MLMWRVNRAAAKDLLPTGAPGRRGLRKSEGGKRGIRWSQGSSSSLFFFFVGAALHAPTPATRYPFQTPPSCPSLVVFVVPSLGSAAPADASMEGWWKVSQAAEGWRWMAAAIRPMRGTVTSTLPLPPLP